MKKTLKATRVTGKAEHNWLSKTEKEKVNASFSENALRMMKKRYLAADESGKQETPADMFHRVAHALSEVEKISAMTAVLLKKLKKIFGKFFPRKNTLLPAGL